jgi:hypothetical protein
MGTPDRDNTLTAAHVLVIEYEALKREQQSRIGFRDNLIYATLVSVAGVLAFTAQSGDAGFLLALPPASLALGWTYLVNDHMVTQIGRYLREHLAPRLNTLVPDARALGWELTHRADGRRRSRKMAQLGVDVMLFCLTGLAAVIGFWMVGPRPTPLLWISIVETLTMIGLGTQFVRYADLGRKG